MPISNESLKQTLAELEILPADKLEEVYKSATTRGESLGDFLVERNIISDSNLGRVMADLYGISFINLRNESVPEEVLAVTPVEMVKHRKIFPFRLTDEKLYLAVNDPEDLEAVSAIRKKMRGKAVELYYATKADIDLAATRYRKDIQSVFKEIIVQVEKKLAEKPDLTIEDQLKELPVVEMVDLVLIYAYQSDASDAHIEPHERDVLVRFRIDGIMHDTVRYPKYMHDVMVTRLKIMAKLRTDEHFAAQDGKIRTLIEGETVDIRLNVVPILEGEKVVMRLLTERGKHFYLENLGLDEGAVNQVLAAVKKPYGMILATGPTGSGKSTTLYAILKLLNTPEVNITTIEDPIEYDIPGVNQIQVNVKTGITFATGLKAIVRQNPDIIMVGEIRDEETASIAVNAAMTGHQVLSTLHTNNAATTLPRLIDMKIEPFLIASSVNIILAQRLVRRICPRCVRTAVVEAADAKKTVPEEIMKLLFGKRKNLTLYAGAKCSLCRYTGYLGRIGIFEIINVTESIRALIMNKANSDEIEREAVKEGMRPVLLDGINKVLSGQTTIEEILRVTRT